MIGKLHFLIVLIAGMLAVSAAAAEVEAVGRAVGDIAKARELALAEALRDAVRQGAGVDIVSESKVDNFQLQYDRVITSSFGYVQSYTVTAQDYDRKEQCYSVKIKAKVSKGRPAMNNLLALKLLMQRMKSPRVIVESEESIRGLDNEKVKLAMVPLESMARNIGLQVVSAKAVQNRNRRESLRAGILNDKLDEKVKAANIQMSSDFKIMAKLSGSVGREREPFPGVKVRDASLGVDLQAVWTDSGEVFASTALPTAMFKGEKYMNTGIDAPLEILRFHLKQMLEGKIPEFAQNNGISFFNMIVARWISELDLGAIMQIEFKQISKKDLDKLIAKLRDVPGVNTVYLREFDSRLFSTIELESRLDAQQLAAVISKNLNNIQKLDLCTKHRLLFIPAK